MSNILKENYYEILKSIYRKRVSSSLKVKRFINRSFIGLKFNNLIVKHYFFEVSSFFSLFVFSIRTFFDCMPQSLFHRSSVVSNRHFVAELMNTLIYY